MSYRIPAAPVPCPQARRARWTALKHSLKAGVVGALFSYGPDRLVATLHRLGIAPGDTVMVHSSWSARNGFRGSPAEFLAALQRAVGPEGLLVMPSMPYHNQSSAEYLALGRPLDVRRTPSRMGLLTEVFRRSPEVRRSLSPTHPVLAWGLDADGFVDGHERTDRPFGPGSPFARLLARNGKVLLVDAAFASVTFTHYVEDRIAGRLPMPLYDPEPRVGVVIGWDGERLTVPTRVISAAAHRARREERLVWALNAGGVIRRGRVGNTRLRLLDCRSMTAVAERLAATGQPFFDPAP